MSELHKPQFVDYGPACAHDMPCPAWWDCGYHAVYEMNDGVFLPSWEAQKAGFVLLQVRWPQLRRLLQCWFPPKAYAGWPNREDYMRGKTQCVAEARSPKETEKRVLKVSCGGVHAERRPSR